MFKEPIEILPTVCYTACATLKVRMPDSTEENGILVQAAGFLICLLMGKCLLGLGFILSLVVKKDVV